MFKNTSGLVNIHVADTSVYLRKEYCTLSLFLPGPLKNHHAVGCLASDLISGFYCFADIKFVITVC